MSASETPKRFSTLSPVQKFSWATETQLSRICIKDQSHAQFGHRLQQEEGCELFV